MAFIISGQTFISFAEYDDVVNRDQRIFEQNEILTEQIVEDMLIRASERILTRIKASDWWQEYQFKRDITLKNDARLLPNVNGMKIEARKNDFTDLCVYQALAEYILPKIADFSDENSSERQKILYYTDKSNALFTELIEAGDWYDFDDDGSVETGEKMPSRVNLVRIR